MRAVIYARVSRAADVSTDTSTPRQVTNCRQFLESRGWYEHAVHRDVDRSAYRSGVLREGFETLLRDVTTGQIDVVVVWKLDRLTRRPGDFERFWSLCEHHRVHLASVTEPIDTTGPMGLAIVRLLMTFAGIESTVRGERIAARYREQALQGHPFHAGRRPFGHSKDLSSLVEDEAALLREAARRVIDGELLTEVARDFGRRGVISSHGVPWTRAGLRSTLCSARMVGDRSYHGEVVVEGCFAPILDRRTHQLVVSMLTDTPKRLRPTRSLLQGVLTCGNCGQHLVRSLSRRGRGMYKCPAPPQGCQRISVIADPTEGLVVAAARVQLRRGNALGEPHVEPEHAANLNALNKAYFNDHAITRTEWYATRRAMVDDSNVRATWWRLHPDIPAGMTPEQLDQNWATLSRSAQRAILAGVLLNVTVAPQPTRGGGFRPERLTITFRQPSVVADRREDVTPTHCPGEADVPTLYPQLDDPAWLRREYVERRRTAKDLARELGCSRSLVTTTLSEHDIRKAVTLRSQVPVDWLREQYVEEGRSLADVGAQAGVSWMTIRRALADAGIPLRQRRLRSPRA